MNIEDKINKTSTLVQYAIFDNDEFVYHNNVLNEYCKSKGECFEWYQDLKICKARLADIKKQFPNACIISRTIKTVITFNGKIE